MTSGGLLERAIAAQGGRDRWAALDAVRLRVTSGGLAFASKGQGRAVRGALATVSTRGQRVTIDPFAGAAHVGVLDGAETRIEDASGRVVARRSGRPGGLARLRRLVRWDDLEMLGFAGAALWTYASLPFVAERPGYSTREVGSRRYGSEVLHGLEIELPPEVRTHSPRQVLWFDDAGLLRRHDYTALAFGRLARAAHHVGGHREIDGLVVGTRRRVVPRAPGGAALPGPTLVWIELEPPDRGGP